MAAIQQFEDATPRPGVPKRLVVVTDGVYSSSSDLSDSLDVLQTKAIYTTLIGVGVQSTDPDSLGQVITDPNLLSGLLSEVASEKESIVLYQDAAQFMDDENTPVLDAICPGIVHL